MKKLINRLKQVLKITEEDSIEAMNETLSKRQLDEMSIAWADESSNKCCWVENPTGYNNKYFKYVNSFSYIKGKNMARISMLGPNYLDHKFMDGKKPWTLNNKEKKELMDLMNQPNEDFPEQTNWQMTICQYNLDNFGISRKKTISGNIDKKKYPKALDINMPMPNYLELP